MDEDNNYSYFIEEEFQIKDCDKKEQLRHIRELEEKRNLQEQREIQLERIERQIVNTLNITPKSDNETERSNNTKSQASVKPNSKQNEMHKPSRTDIQMSSNTIPNSRDKRKPESYKTVPFHSERNSSHDRSPYFKGTSYRRDGFHGTRQRRPHRASRGRSSNYRPFNERIHNQNRPFISNSQPESGLNEKQKAGHGEEKTDAFSEFEFPPELIPTNVQEEEEMLQEAIELSKQQMFIEKLEKRETDKAIEETIRNQEAVFSSDGRKPQKQFSNRMVSKKNKDVPRSSLSSSNSNITSENKQAMGYNKQEKINHSVTNSKQAKINKILKPELISDKQNINVTSDRNFYHRQASKSKHPHQNQKKSLETYKQNSSNQVEPTVSRSDLTEEAIQSFSDKSADYDINSSNWKECARKNLKQLLHLDNSPEASVGAEDVETLTDLLKTDTLHCDTNNGETNTRCNTQLDENFYKEENYREKFNARHSPKCSYNSSHLGNENSYGVPIKSSDCFRNYGTRKAGNRSRMSDRRYPRTQHNSRPSNINNTNDNESACIDWKPYPKLAGEGRTDSIPPRFRKKYQQVIS